MSAVHKSQMPNVSRPKIANVKCRNNWRCGPIACHSSAAQLFPSRRASRNSSSHACAEKHTTASRRSFFFRIMFPHSTQFRTCVRPFPSPHRSEIAPHRAPSHHIVPHRITPHACDWPLEMRRSGDPRLAANCATVRFGKFIHLISS